MKLLLHARRGHSQLDHTRLGAPLARGAEAPEVVRAQGHLHPQQTALPQRKSRGPVRIALETYFFLATVRFSRKITTPPQVLELQVHTPERLQRVASVAPKGVRDGGFEVTYMYHDSATAVRSSFNGAQKEVG